MASPRFRISLCFVLLMSCGVIAPWWSAHRSASPTHPSSTSHPVPGETASHPVVPPASARSGFASPQFVPGQPLTAAVSVAVSVGKPEVSARAMRYNGQVLWFGESQVAQKQLEELVASLSGDEKVVVLVGFDHALTVRERAQWEAGGYEVKGYVPENGFLVRLHSGTRTDLPVLGDLRVLERLGPEWRVDPQLRVGSEDMGRERGVRIRLWNGRQAEGVVRELERLGFAGWSHGGGWDGDVLVNRVDGLELDRLLREASRWEEVVRIEAAGSARLMNNAIQSTLQGGAFDGPRPFFSAGIYGSNQVIAICDTGLDLDSCYFRDANQLPALNGKEGVGVSLLSRKVMAVNFWYSGDRPANNGDWDNQGHGTFVAGTAAGWKLGLPYSSQSYNGMAPGSRLIIQDCGFVGSDPCADLIGLGCPVTNFLPVLRQAYLQGARIHNNSWGDREDAIPHNTYTEPCRELDGFTWGHKDFLVVCAAGNDGGIDTVSSPSISKNALSVGATANNSGQNRIASFSSRGWASDGRWKPDLVAPGEGIISAAGDGSLGTDNCGLSFASGTSFSSPATAGAAALVRDYFAQGFYPYTSPGVAVTLQARHDLSAALVKALLIQSTVPVKQAAGSVPGRDQGWGRPNLSSTLPLKDGDPVLWVKDAAPVFQHSQSASYVCYVRVRSTNQPLRITLVWTDPPALPGADLHLVNDLDLHLRSGAISLSGNVMKEGESVEGGVSDSLNNVERILVAAPVPGTYELEVHPRRIVEGAQDFALVVQGDLEVYPLSRDDDRDGLPDGWEWMQLGGLSGAGGGDADRDGVNNVDEFSAGTDPMDPGSVLRLEARLQKSGEVELEFWTARDRNYTVEYADDLGLGIDGAIDFVPFSNPWVVSEARVRQSVEGAGRVKVVDDFTRDSSGGTSKSGARYYRVRSAAPVGG